MGNCPGTHPSSSRPIQPFMQSTRYSSLHIPTFLFYPALHVIHPLFIPPHSYLPVLSSPSRYPPVIHPSTFLPSCSIQPFTLSTRYSSLHIPTFLFYPALHAIHPLFIPPHSYLPVLSSPSRYPPVIHPPHSYLPVLSSPSRYPPVIHPSTFLPSCSIQPFTLSTRYSFLHIPIFLFYPALHAIHPLFIPPRSYLPVLSSPSRHPPIIHPSTFLPSCSIQPFTPSTHYSSLHIPTFLFYPALHAIHPLFIPPHSYLPVLFSPSRHPPIIHPSTFLPSCSIQPFTLSTRYSSPHSYLPVLFSPSCHPPIIHPSTFLPSCSIQPFTPSTHYSSPHSYLPVLFSPSCSPPPPPCPPSSSSMPSAWPLGVPGAMLAILFACDGTILGGSILMLGSQAPNQNIK